MKFYLTKKELARVKKAAKYANLDYAAIAARPKTAMDFCRRVEKEIKKELDF